MRVGSDGEFPVAQTPCESLKIRAGAIASGRKVAVVHDWIFSRRGGERVLEAILALFPDAHVHALFGHPDPASILALRPGSRHVFRYSFLQSVPFIGRIYKHLLPLLPVAAESMDLTGYDLVVSSSHCAAKGVIVAPQARHVCYIHSLMRYAWDQEHRYFPTPVSFRSPLEILRRILLSRLRVWDVTSAARIDRLVANSAFVARRARLYYGRQASVVHPNVDAERFSSVARTNLPAGARKVLLFGAWVPYKRMRAALDALVAAGVPVVAAGQGACLEAARKAHQGNASVEFVVSPSDPEVALLFARCHVLLFPAVEDFGIVPLEATAAGMWVVAPSVGGTAETVVHGGTGFHFQEGNAADMLTCVRQALAKDIDAASQAAGLFHARKFGTTRFQSELLSEIEEALA